MTIGDSDSARVTQKRALHCAAIGADIGAGMVPTICSTMSPTDESDQMGPTILYSESMAPNGPHRQPRFPGRDGELKVGVQGNFRDRKPEPKRKFRMAPIVAQFPE